MAIKLKKHERKIESKVFDESTMHTLYTLIKKEFIEEVGQPISVGKEANVFKAKKGDENFAVKIYRIETSTFNKMLPYIEGDPRFQVKKDKRSIVYTWAKKELRNLRRAYKAGVSVPRPWTSMKNVLVMEFIGDEEAAPLLKHTTLEDPKDFFEQILDSMKKLYKAGLVHGDLSEYNIMVWKDKPVLIDIGQGVVLEHPMAQELLQRDAEKIAKFFSKLGVEISAEKIVKSIASA